MTLSPNQSSKRLTPSQLLITDNPESNPNSDTESSKRKGGEDDQTISQTIIAGPSSPSRRRSRPSGGRRRSSSITAAAELMASYPTQPNKRRGSKDSSNASVHKGKAKMNEERYQDDEQEDDDENHGLLQEYEEFLPHPSQNFRPRPYHIAIVSCLAALGNGIPLPTVFALYEHVMCAIVGDEDEKSISTLQVSLQKGQKKGFWSILFPPSPSLPRPAACPADSVASLTSYYSSALAVTGALLSLFILQLLTSLTIQKSTSTLGFKFKKLGRKPPLILLHFFLSLTYLFCAIFPILFLPKHPITTAITLGLSRVLADANNGSPLMLLTQNFVFDTTAEDHHASSLAFVDGFAQLGSFPSAAIGGWIAALTRSFWSPFYTAAAVLTFASIYIMACVPESRKGFREGVAKEEEEEEQQDQQGDDVTMKHQKSKRDLEDSATGNNSQGRSGNSFSSTDPSNKNSSSRHRYSPLRLISFLSPLLLFLPVSLPSSSSRSSSEASSQLSTASKRRRLRSLVLPPLLFLLSMLEACYNVFILPALLLYNTDILNLSVTQNGLVVSGLQAIRGLWLILCWPRLLHWWRNRSSIQEQESRNETQANETQANETQANETQANETQANETQATESQRVPTSSKKPKRPNPMIRPSYGSTSFSPQTPLPDGASSQHEKGGPRRSGDLVPLMFSYTQATLGFVILASSRSPFWSNNLIPIVLGTWILETGSGAHSCRTSLTVKLLGGIITEKRELDSNDQGQTSNGELEEFDQQGPSKSTSKPVQRSSQDQDQVDADLETSLLSSLQLLATLTLSSIPVLTSAVYSWGLQIDLPESVWILKALCSVGSFLLAGMVWWVDGW